MKDDHINVFFSEKDGCWVADTPDLKHRSAFGDSAEDAVREVPVAREGWLETARAENKPIPEPRYRPAICRTVA